MSSPESYTSNFQDLDSPTYWRRHPELAPHFNTPTTPEKTLTTPTAPATSEIPTNLDHETVPFSTDPAVIPPNANFVVIPNPIPDKRRLWLAYRIVRSPDNPDQPPIFQQYRSGKEHGPGATTTLSQLATYSLDPSKANFIFISGSEEQNKAVFQQMFI
jgi:hypothetical protein